MTKSIRGVDVLELPVMGPAFSTCSLMSSIIFMCRIAVGAPSQTRYGFAALGVVEIAVSKQLSLWVTCQDIVDVLAQ